MKYTLTRRGAFIKSLGWRERRHLQTQPTVVPTWSLVSLWDKWRVYGEPWLALHLTSRVTYISKVEPSLQGQALVFTFPTLTWTAWTTCPLTGFCSSLELKRLWTSATSQRSSMCSQRLTWKCTSLYIVITHAGMPTWCLFSYITIVHWQIQCVCWLSGNFFCENTVCSLKALSGVW